MPRPGESVVTVPIPVRIVVRDPDTTGPPDVETNRELAFDVRVPDLHLLPELGPALVAVVTERFRQRERGYDAEHDDGHGHLDWLDLVTHQVAAAHRAEDLAGYRERLVRAAALAVAAVEWCDRLPAGDRDPEAAD